MDRVTLQLWTSLRRSEEQLASSNKQLALARDDLDAFSYSMAHQLRGPIRQIAGFANILAKEYGSHLPQEAYRHLERVRRGAEQIGETSDHLLHWAHVAQQALMLQSTVFNVIVFAALESLCLESSDRTIDWRIEDLGRVDCDRVLMQEAFSALLSNALKYTRSRDSAVIEVYRRDLHGECVFSVRDNGAGFDMQRAENLFGLFQALDGDGDGTGMGLAIAARIVRKHGGRISAQAEPAGGATFSFTLPLLASER